MLRLPPDKRYAQLAEIGVELAEVSDYRMVQFGQIAQIAGVTRTLVQHYFKNRFTLQNVILKTAIQKKNLRVVAQGVIAGDPAVMDAPARLRQRALREVRADAN